MSTETSTPNHGIRMRKPVLATLLIMVVAIFTQLVALIGIDVLVGIDYLPITSYTIIFQITLLVLYFWIKDEYKVRTPASEGLGFRWSIKKWFAVYGLILLFGFIVAMIFSPFTTKTTSVYETLAISIIDVFFLLFASSIMAPIVEELVFRKFMLDRVVWYMDKRKSLLLSALIFSMIHWISDIQSSTIDVTIPHAISTFFLGVLLGYVYLKTKNIKHTIVLHAIHNFISFIPLVISILYPYSEDDYSVYSSGGVISDAIKKNIILNTIMNISLLVIVGISLIYGLYIVFRNRKEIIAQIKITSKDFVELFKNDSYLTLILMAFTILVVIPMISYRSINYLSGPGPILVEFATNIGMIIYLYINFKKL